MKAYVYTPEECGIQKFSDGILRLNAETTRNPNEADVFVCPEPLFKFVGPKALQRLPYMSDMSCLHAFLDLSEHFTAYENTDCIFIRAALTKDAAAREPNAIAWPWPVKNLGPMETPMVGFTYDVTFHGWLSGLVRKVSSRTCASSRLPKNNGRLLMADVVTYPNFFGYQTPDEQANRTKLMLAGMRQSRVALTAESIPGVLPYRFFEAMSAGRCQLYIGRNYTLPFADKIPYHNFVNFLDIDQADEADVAIQDWCNRYPDFALEEKGLEAYHYWDKWLNPDKWIDLMTVAVEEKLKSI